MEKNNRPSQPAEVPVQPGVPGMTIPPEYEPPISSEENPDLIPEEDPFEDPLPYEVPPPGEAP